MINGVIQWPEGTPLSQQWQPRNRPIDLSQVKTADTEQTPRVDGAQTATGQQTSNPERKFRRRMNATHGPTLARMKHNQDPQGAGHGPDALAVTTLEDKSIVGC